MIGGTANGNDPAGALPRGGVGGESQGEGVVLVLGGRGHRHLHPQPLGPLDLDNLDFGHLHHEPLGHWHWKIVAALS